jgi:hypothetical protein
VGPRYLGLGRKDPQPNVRNRAAVSFPWLLYLQLSLRQTRVRAGSVPYLSACSKIGSMGTDWRLGPEEILALPIDELALRAPAISLPFGPRSAGRADLWRRRDLTPCGQRSG